jgi:plasmid stability protein
LIRVHPWPGKGNNHENARSFRWPRIADECHRAEPVYGDAGGAIAEAAAPPAVLHSDINMISSQIRRPNMPNLTVRKIPKDVHRRLKATAKRNHRSLNAEILAVLADEDAWALRRLQIAAVLPELAKARVEIAREYPNAPESVELIREDRDSR